MFGHRVVTNLTKAEPRSNWVYEKLISQDTFCRTEEPLLLNSLLLITFQLIISKPNVFDTQNNG